MDSFNLNSDAYTESEIEDLFNLKAVYNTKDIALAKTVLIQQLTRTQDLGVEKQREIMFFIDTIANRIINKINKINTINLPQENSVITQGTNFIIENPDRIAGKHSDFTNGRITIDSTNAPPGYINPINVRTITQAISFDTRFRPNYYTTKSTNFSMVLPAIQKNVVSMRVATIELPLTYYAISQTQGNATCLIIELPITNSATNCWILNLPDGNYEQSWADRSRAEHIETAMNSAIIMARPATIDVNGIVTPIINPVPTDYLLATDLTYSLDHISGRSIFATPVNAPSSPTPSRFTYGFTMRFNVDNAGSLNMDTSIQLRLGWLLGFRSAEYVCEIINPPSSSLCISEGICLVSGPRYGFLAIDDHQKNTGPAYMVAYGNSILQNNIITRINLAALQAQVGIYQSSSDAGLTTQVNRTREYFGPVDIQRLHISLYDEFGRIIDLNNMDWSFSLAFEILYN
uniref:Uncharacterized protein n=1 Tax=viral metagenome TaxID=1070528 RepID=A0A6C0II77_9ZZZZ